MPSWLADTIKGLGKKGFSQLLNAVLLRIPVVVMGPQERAVNLFIVNLAKLVPHREQVIFWTDFVTAQEAEQLFEDEKQSHENKRVIILCNSNVLRQALQKMSRFQSWVIAFKPKTKEEISTLLAKLHSSSKSFLIVSLLSDKPKVQVYGEKTATTSFKLENKIISNVIENANASITRLSRLITKKIGKNGISKQLLSSVINFDAETAMIQQDLYEKEISEFVHAARRAFALLTRIKLVHEFGLKIRIDSQTLLDTINYDKGDPAKLLQFIQAEYGDDFSNCLGTGRMSRIGDWIDGMWGVQADNQLA
ncbi:MAG: hypothetical protein ACTSW4_03160 [Candidatus Ranarchaeia archaeon]